MKNFQDITAVILRIILIGVVSVNMAGCGDNDASSSNNPVGAVSSTAAAVNLAGSVGDGPVTGATVQVWSSGGRILGEMTSDNTASFRSTLKVKGKDYPLLLKVSGGVDLVTGGVPDFQLLSVMQSPSDKQVNITPFSTLIVLVAEQMPGGLDSGNVATARQFVTGRLGFGLDAALIDDPITAQVTDTNVANMVKSSETFGEMVRRTRDLVTATGRLVSGDDVLRALAADLQDGLVDGLGASGTDTTISAVANVVSGQVLVEALSNNLKVGGVVATGVIDQAIQITHPQVASSQLTSSVRVTAGMLQQTQGALAAVQVVDNSAGVQNIVAEVGTVSANALPVEVALVLPADSSALLDNALTKTAYATQDEMLAINLAVTTGPVSGDTVTDQSGGSTGSGSTAGTTLSNTAPVIGGSPALSVVAGNNYLFQPVASDADGDALTYNVANLPGWATFSSATGTLSGVPDIGEAGNYSNIVISVTDGSDTASLNAFGITVSVPVVVNTPPVIGGVPATSVTANSHYQFQPGASDADADTLKFSITGLPVWASFDVSSGRLSGTPADSDAGNYSNIVITVTDGKDSASLPAFNVSVTMPVIVNSPPVIGGVPALSVTANSGYLFQPNASDADGDSLSFGVTNLPVWASFDASSGRLSGMPGDGDVGSFNNIVISVTDGVDVAQLQPFGITVVADQTQTGMFTLSWVAPTSRADGTPLAMSDIDGFHIHYGDLPGKYTNTMTIADGSAVTATVNNLPVGDYYLVMTTYDVDGLESDYSAEISKQAQ